MSDPFSEADSVFDERYIEAVIHAEKHVVLGRRLRPFSMWHRTQFEAFALPILTEPGRMMPNDLRLAVNVCRTIFPNTAKPPATKGVRGWWNRIMGLWSIHTGSFAVEMNRLQIYVADYYSTPVIEFLKKGEGEQEPDVDEGLDVVANYRSVTGCPRSEPWDMPIGELYWMHVVIAKQKGAKFSIRTTIADAAIDQARIRLAIDKSKRKVEGI